MVGRGEGLGESPTPDLSGGRAEFLCPAPVPPFGREPAGYERRVLAWGVSITEGSHVLRQESGGPSFVLRRSVMALRRGQRRGSDAAPLASLGGHAVRAYPRKLRGNPPSGGA